MPQPVPLTPADTSGSVAPGLAAALRAHHGRVDEVITDHAPTPAHVGGPRPRPDGRSGRRRDGRGLVRRRAGRARPRGAPDRPSNGHGALRTPWDLATYPGARTHVATYGLLPPSPEALAAALWGRIRFRGRLPVRMAS